MTLYDFSEDPAPDPAELADGEPEAANTFVPNPAPHAGIGNQAVDWFATGEDLAEHRQAQTALNQAQKLKVVGQLTSGIAHDFNNLLTVVLGNLAVLKEGLQGNPELYEAAHTAMNAARRGADLTRRLLAFSRQQTLQPRLLSPGQQIQEIGELLKRALGSNIELETVVDNSVWNIRVDPGQLTNAILNLAINARDAMPQGGQLRIEAGNVTLDISDPLRHADVAPGDYVQWVVSDTGCGMAPEVLEQAFELFFTTKEFGVGTGLGLSMVYGFVKQSGGHVRIRSQVDVGTAVELYLPRYIAKGKNPSSSPVNKATRDENALRGRETILVVEDESDIRDFVTRSLAGFGYRVSEAANGREALEILASGEPVDLLLSDMTMPGGVDGYDLSIEARRQRPEIKVLCMSGHSEQILSQGLPPGCVFLEKPFLKQDLIRVVREVLNRTAETDSSGE